MMKKLMVILLGTILSGCISPSAKLSDNSGKKMQCSASGFGLVLGEMAKSDFNKCVADAQSKGFKIDSVSN